MHLSIHSIEFIFFHLWYNQKQVPSSHSCIITLYCTFLEDLAPFIRIMEYFRLFFSGIFIPKIDAYLLFGQWHFDIDISFHRRPHNTFELLKLPGLEIGKLEQSRIHFSPENIDKLSIKNYDIIWYDKIYKYQTCVPFWHSWNVLLLYWEVLS